MTLITVPCDLCGATAFEAIYPGTISCDDHDPSIYYSSSRARAGYLPIVRCVNCGLVMTNPRDDDATLAQVYANLQDEVYDAEDDNRLRTARDHLALVMKHQPEPARLLDVGCATGMFVCAAQTAGWQVTGLEASPWAVERARERCPQVTLVAGLLEEVDFPSDGFEAVTLWDVLEHVGRPSDTLRRVQRWLADGGYLFLNLPDVSSWTARLMGRHWVLLLREHLWYFSPATMAALLRRTGFELIEARPNTVHFSPANIAGRLAQQPGPIGRLGQRLSGRAGLKRMSVKFRMGEMQVVGRKLGAGHNRSI